MILPVLAAYLAGQGIGTVGVNLFYGIMPPDPDICVCLYEYPGPPNETVLDGGLITKLEHPKIQAKIRGAKDDYDGPRQKAQDIVTAFTKIVNGNQIAGIQSVIAVQTPFKMGSDANFRFEFVCNFQVMKLYTP